MSKDSKYKVGETFRQDKRTMVWVICPICKEERSAYKNSSTQSDQRLCKECGLRKAKAGIGSLWKGSS